MPYSKGLFDKTEKLLTEYAMDAVNASSKNKEPSENFGADRESLHVQKLGLNMVPPQFTECVAKVFDFGKKKYAENNWMKGLSISSTIASLERHALALKRGEELDADSGLPHECHIAANAAFLNWFLHGPDNPQYRHDFDDRVFKDFFYASQR